MIISLFQPEDSSDISDYGFDMRFILANNYYDICVKFACRFFLMFRDIRSIRNGTTATFSMELNKYSDDRRGGARCLYFKTKMSQTDQPCTRNEQNTCCSIIFNFGIHIDIVVAVGFIVLCVVQVFTISSVVRQ